MILKRITKKTGKGEKKMKKRIISLGLVLGLISALIVPVVAFAGTLTNVDDTLGSYATSASSVQHVIEFDNVGALNDGDTITVYFDTAFTTADGTQTANVSLAGTSVAEGTGATAIGSAANDTMIFTLGTGGSVPASTSDFTMTISTAAGMGNPGTASTYTVQVVTNDSTGPVIDSGYCLVDIGAGRTASVTVKTLISATITDEGNAGINFGAVDPGASDVPEEGHDGATNGAVTVTIGSEVNVTTYVYTKADNWTGAGTLNASDGTFNDANDTGTDAAMSTSYQQLDAGGGGLAADGVMKVYHWLSIPNNTTADDYSSLYYYQVLATGT